MLADRYELRDLLGVGGMAEVHEAMAHGAHGFVRRVAIKRLLLETSDDPTIVRMFLDEARIASKLHHASIVAVLDYAVADDVPFQVLELVDGWNTAALMRQVKARGQTMPLDIALYIATEVAHALTYAHEAKDERGVPLGIVHRDVKPSNVLVSRGGDVKLGDFGIALARERASKTTGFVARGTPGYMSPEQLLGTGVDLRTDIFALGCTLHALLTGWSPLTEESAREALMRGTKLPVAAALPPGILAIVERAVSVEAGARFATAREMALALGGELSQLLRTDPKSRMLQWLQLLAVPPRASTTTIGTSVLTASTLTSTIGSTKLASTLAATDRIFTSRTAPMAGPSHPPPAYASPAYASGRPPAYASYPPSAGSYPPHGALPRTVDSTGASRTKLSNVRAPKRDNRMLVFAIALLIPIVIAVIAVIGAVVGHQLSTAGAVDAGAATAPLDGAPAARAAEASADAAATLATASPKAPGKTGASSPSTTVTASGIAGTGPPVKDGCICIAEHEGGTTGVCHPQVVHTPACRCKLPGSTTLCWVAYDKGGPAQCPERARAMPASVRDGEPCVGFLEVTTSTKTATGFVEHTSTEPARSGVLDACDRCAGSGRTYPRTHGAPCVGIAPPTGTRVQGKVNCQ